jgi:hypothetical protein
MLPPRARQAAPASTSARLGPCDVLPLPVATPPVGVGPFGVGWPGLPAAVVVDGGNDGVVGRADDVGGVYLACLVAVTGGSFGCGNQPGGGVFGPNARSGLFCVGSVLDGSPPDGGRLPPPPWPPPPPVAGSVGVDVCVGGRDGLSLCVDGAVDGLGSELDWVGDALALCVGSVVSEDVADGLVLAIAIGAAMPASTRPAERAAAWRVRLTHGAMDDLSKGVPCSSRGGTMPQMPLGR